MAASKDDNLVESLTLACFDLTNGSFAKSFATVVQASFLREREAEIDGFYRKLLSLRSRLLGSFKSLSSDVLGAALEFRESLRLMPGELEANLLLASCLLEQGLLDESNEIYSKLLAVAMSQAAEEETASSEAASAAAAGIEAAIDAAVGGPNSAASASSIDSESKSPSLTPSKTGERDSDDDTDVGSPMSADASRSVHEQLLSPDTPASPVQSSSDAASNSALSLPSLTAALVPSPSLLSLLTAFIECSRGAQVASDAAVAVAARATQHFALERPPSPSVTTIAWILTHRAGMWLVKDDKGALKPSSSKLAHQDLLVARTIVAGGMLFFLLKLKFNKFLSFRNERSEWRNPLSVPYSR